MAAVCFETPSICQQLPVKNEIEQIEGILG